MITKESEALYSFKDNDYSFSVHLMDDKIFIFGDGDFQQMIENPYRAEPRQYHLMFSKLDKIKDGALVYKEGVTNREKLLEEIKRLHRDNRISSQDVLRLNAFVDNLEDTTAADSVKKRMILLGYERIVDAIDFEEEHPLLASTCEGFLRFVSESRQFFKDKQ